VQEESVRGVAGFLADAARAAVSTRTVVQVLQHWVTEGVTFEDLHAAVHHARETVGGGREQEHERRLARYEKAIHAGLVLSPCGNNS
jgi:hypothetical protein